MHISLGIKYVLNLNLNFEWRMRNSLTRRDTAWLFPELRINEGDNHEVSCRVSEFFVGRDRAYIILVGFLYDNKWTLLN